MKFRQLLLAGCLASILGLTLFGQSFTASVRGTIADQQETVTIPGAKVIITDAERGTPSNTTADDLGRFVVTALPPGNYVLTVQAPGFKTFSSGRFTLTVQQQANRSMPLSRSVTYPRPSKFKVPRH